MAVLNNKEGVLMTDGDMTGDVTSDVARLGDAKCYCAHAVWTANDAAVGNIILQGSFDGTTFFTIATQAAGGGGGFVVWEKADVAYTFVRVFYDFTSDGTADVLNIAYRIKD
jgi:hypothetical protein